jgi:hypothetical protein
MPKINKVYPPFFNGVSQQQTELILDNQCKEMINCVPDLVAGLTKRPAAKFSAARDFDTYPTLENATVFHTYDRGEDLEEYIFLENDDPDDPVLVYNKQGQEMVVTYQSDNEAQVKSYLQEGSLKALTVQDRTWIFSRNAEVDLDYDETEPLDEDYDKVAYYWLKRGSGDRFNPFNYAVYLDGVGIACNPDKPEIGGTAAQDPATGFEDSDYAATYLASVINRERKGSWFYTGIATANTSNQTHTFNVGLGLTSVGFQVTVPTGVSYTTPSYNTGTGIVTFTTTNTTSNELEAELKITAYTPSQYECEVSGSMLKIYRTDLADFEYSTWDSWGSQASEGWKGSVNKISDLPREMPFADSYVEITGTENNEFTNYYVKWNGSSWEECLDPAADRGRLTLMPIKCDRIQLNFNEIDYTTIDPDQGAATYIHMKDPATNTSYDYSYKTELNTIIDKFENDGYLIWMYNVTLDTGGYYSFDDVLNAPINTFKWPVFWNTGMGTLTRSESFIGAYGQRATFLLDIIEWSTPRVGNLDNNPDPSFAPDVDGNRRKITDLFFYKNRLGIASEDSVTLSETGNYTNFYATTALDLVDTDVVDVTVATNQASQIYYVKPFNNSLYIFTKYAQYELIADGIFSPSTVALQNTTNYPMALGVEPVVVNDSLYFVSTTDNRQQLREYIKGDNLNVKGVDLNVSTPSYLDKPIVKLIADGVLGYVLCCTADNTIYLYNYKEDGTQRIQSAWSTWTLLNGLGHQTDTYEYYNIQSTLLVICKTADDYRYHTLQLDSEAVNDNVDTSASTDGVTTDYSYEASILLPDYYPKLGNVRTPMNKMLIKKITIEGEGSFDATVYRKDYNHTFTKLHTGGLADLDLHVASKVGKADITIKDSSADDFKITSIVVEGLFSTTSREMN